MTAGFVSLVGAGPWDPELLTLAARERLRQADVVIADYLVNPAVLVHCKRAVEILQRVRGSQAGPRLPQDRINTLMVEHAKAGRYVVRLKGGDPMMFGRGAEEASHLRDHGVEFEFVPGVSSPIAAPEAAGIPITHRAHTPSVSFVSGYEAYQKAGLTVAWTHLANSAGTLVLMMSVKNAAANAERLVAAGRSPDTPTAVVRWGTRGIQRTVVGTLGDIAERIAAAGIRAPAVMVVGDVVKLREKISWLERRPLFGRRVIVTRAAPQAGSLITNLARAGADAVAFPCLEFVDPGADASAALDAALLAQVRSGESGASPESPDSCRPYAGIIVSSPNGADALFAALARLELDVRALAGTRVAAIGTGTADRCIERGLRPDLVPTRARSEGLIEALREAGSLTERWMQIRADEGRDLIGAALREAGGHLDLFVGYRTLRPAVSPLLIHSLRSEPDGGEGWDAICFASGRTARHFLATMAEGMGETQARARLQAAKVVAIGPVTRDAIEAMGVRVDAVATTPSDAGMCAAVVELLGVPPDQTEQLEQP